MIPMLQLPPGYGPLMPLKSPEEQAKDGALILVLGLFFLLVLWLSKKFHLSLTASVWVTLGSIFVIGITVILVIAKHRSKLKYIPRGEKLTLGEWTPGNIFEKVQPFILGVKDFVHVILTGTTRYGKSTLIRRFIREIAKNDLGFLYVDFKGDQNDFDEILRISRSMYLEDRIQIFDLSKPEDCLSCNLLTVFKDINETVGFALEIFELDDPYYRGEAERFLRNALKLFDHTGELRTFINLELLFYDSKYRGRLMNSIPEKDQRLPFFLYFAHDFDVLDREERLRRFSGFISKIGSFTDGPLKEIFNPKVTAFKLSKIFDENLPAVIRIPGEAYGDLSTRIVQAFLKAIPVLLARRRQVKSAKDYFLFLDEQCSYTSQTVVDILKKAGSANVHCLLTRQCDGDFDAMGPGFHSKVISACSLAFNFMIIDPETRDSLSKQSGTDQSKKETRRVRFGEQTGEASERDVQEFRVAPDSYSELKPGECFVSARLPTLVLDRKLKVYEPAFNEKE